MRKRDTERYRQLLEAQLAELVGHGERTVHALVDDAGDEIPDPSDRATVEEERSGSLRLADRDRKLLGKVREALARLDAGTFGQCARCAGPIGDARLRARPVTDLCIECKTELEGRERRARTRSP
jgi:DnaK suppressor protein